MVFEKNSVRKIRFIKDGNFTPWFRASIWIGASITTVLFYCFATGMLAYWGIMISIVIGYIGAYSVAANTLRLKPFDNSYKKAKATYNEGDANKSSEEKT